MITVSPTYDCPVGAIDRGTSARVLGPARLLNPRLSPGNALRALRYAAPSSRTIGSVLPARLAGLAPGDGARALSREYDNNLSSALTVVLEEHV